MKALDAIWFNNIGIVACENDIGEIKFYVGAGHGFNMEVDMDFIKDHGTKVHPEFVQEFFKRHKKD